MAGSSIPADNPGTSAKIDLVSFGGGKFAIPYEHRYGKCCRISEFEKLAFIGEGAYGIVYKGKRKATNEVVAMKKLKIRRDNEHMPISFSREIRILKSLRHENIVNLFEIAVGMSFQTTYLVLEYCPYALNNVIDDEESKTLLGHPEIKNIMGQIFAGLAYLNKHYILHRDLTVSNILFSPDGRLKISDFGLARLDALKEMTPGVVSRWYRAPELLFGTNKYTAAIDIWAAGCIFGELILKEPVFKANSDMSVMGSMFDLLGTPNENVWPGLSELPLMQCFDLPPQPYNRLGTLFANNPASCVVLLHYLFLYDPKKRISAEACLAHEYFNDHPPACDLSTLLRLLKKSEE